jgi:hypothetical protein
MQKSGKLQKVLWAAHILGWLVIAFIGIGQDDVNLPYLIGGTVLMLLAFAPIAVVEFRQGKANERKH